MSVTWEKVFEKNYDEAYRYNGKAVVEDVAFLANLFDVLLGRWYDWAKYTLPHEVERDMANRGAKLIRQEVYVGSQPILWGLLYYPAIRVVAIYHTSPSPSPSLLTLALIAIIAALGAVIVYYLWQTVKEIDWKALERIAWAPIFIGVGVLAVAFAVAILKR